MPKEIPTVCIVIPTVARTPHTLSETVRSLFSGLEREGRGGCEVILFNAELPSENHGEVPELLEEFGHRGLSVLELSTQHDELSEPETLPCTMGDSHHRVLWRTKQVLDFAMALEAAADSGADYVVLLEDDVEVAPDFLSRTAGWAESWGLESKGDWLLAALFSTSFGVDGRAHQFEFSAVGLMFPNDWRLREMTASFRDRPWREPVDFLIRDFLAETGLKALHCIPNPVQHRGFYSSLDELYKPFLSPTYRRASEVPRVLRAYWTLRWWLGNVRREVLLQLEAFRRWWRAEGR